MKNEIQARVPVRPRQLTAVPTDVVARVPVRPRQLTAVPRDIVKETKAA